MIKQPPYLKKGDKIAIVCPAKKLRKPIGAAIAVLEEWGLQVISGKSVDAAYHQFAGSDRLRTDDMQAFLDDTDIKAIIAGRGGYGTIRIIDQLDFTNFHKNPKWLVGFSDITVLLSHVFASMGIMAIHGQMPGSFEEATPESMESLRKALFGESIAYSYTSACKNIAGQAEGTLIGGNLSILAALRGSVSEMDFQGKILFLEDVGEQEYAIDRMLRMLDRAGKLAGLKALIIGAFNAIKPEEPAFGQSVEEVVRAIVEKYGYPVCFHFPVGHISDNRALVVGSSVALSIQDQEVSFRMLDR